MAAPERHLSHVVRLTAGSVRQLIAHPLTNGMHLDDPRTTHLRKRIIQEKGILRRVYQEWYQAIAEQIPSGDGQVLELGSGAGFLDRFVPDLVTSEIFMLPGLRLAADGLRLPIRDGCLRAIVMTDVLHHLGDARRFFMEAARCLRPGGVVVMHEPWVSAWSRLVYRVLHYEPFEPAAERWELPRGGPLSGANGALPWIIFERDRAAFESAFPEFDVVQVRLGTPLLYVASGGVSTRTLIPGWTYPAWSFVEHLLTPWTRACAMFALITLRRTASPPDLRVQPAGPQDA